MFISFLLQVLSEKKNSQSVSVGVCACVRNVTDLC